MSIDYSTGVVRAGWQTVKPRIVATLLGDGLFGLLAAVGAALFVPGEGADTGDRIAAAAAGFLIAVVTGLILLIVIGIIWLPYRQRDAARDEAKALRGRLAEYETPSFSLAADTAAAPLTPIVVGMGETFEDHTTLWIEVAHEGPDGEYVARVENVDGIARPDGKPIEVNEVAWEHTIEKRNRIEPGGKARLRVGNVAKRPEPTLWFWTARSASYAPDSHAAGWRFRVASAVVSFDVVVVNASANQRLRRRAIIAFDATGGVRNFTLDGADSGSIGGE